MTEYNGSPFEYNPAITNVNIDNQLAGVLSQFNDEYIIDVIKDSINTRFRPYDLPKPNMVSAFETTFKQLTDGFSSNTDEILSTRRRTYENIIAIICDYYDFEFIPRDDTDFYSAAYWLYDFLVSNFTDNLKNFYVMYFIRERYQLDAMLGLSQIKKDNDATLAYSKKLFKDPKLAAIHCNLEYVINQISTFDIDLWNILTCVYQYNENLPGYIYGYVKDRGNFFKNHYSKFVTDSRESADILMYIKLALQELGGQIEPVEA